MDHTDIQVAAARKLPRPLDLLGIIDQNGLLRALRGKDKRFIVGARFDIMEDLASRQTAGCAYRAWNSVLLIPRTGILPEER
jgi:hypothetical protein